MNRKLHAVCDGMGHPVILLLSAGQVSDHTGARLMLRALPAAAVLIGDRCYDSRPFREAVATKGIASCIPSSQNRKVAQLYDKVLHRERHKVEVVFGRLKNWRRVAARYDRCAHTFMSAVILAATVIFWLKQ